MSYGEITLVGRGGEIVVGRYCSIAKGVRALTTGHHTDRVTTYPLNIYNGKWDGDVDVPDVTQHKKYGSLIVENDVWIGFDVLFIGGITIHNGAVIGAKSVVVKDVEPYEIVGGNPAEHIRYRFTSRQVDALQRIAWWNWPKGKIRKNIDLLMDSSRVDEFIKKFDHRR